MQPQVGEQLWPAVATTRERIYVADGAERWIDASESGSVFVLGDQSSPGAGVATVYLPLGRSRQRFRIEHGGPQTFRAQILVYDPDPVAPGTQGTDRILAEGPKTDLESTTSGSSIELEFDIDPATGVGLWRVVSGTISLWISQG